MAFTLDMFINQYPRLYHFTPASNRANLAGTRELRTAATLFGEDGQTGALNTPRITPIQILGGRVTINDQQPLKNFDNPGFIQFLNGLVFFWKGDETNTGHKANKFIAKYKANGYGCIRVKTEHVFNDAINPPSFCIVNSGAPHPLDAFAGKRNPDIFWPNTFTIPAGLKAPSGIDFLKLKDVREIVFRNSVSLPPSTEWKDFNGSWQPL